MKTNLNTSHVKWYKLNKILPSIFYNVKFYKKVCDKALGENLWAFFAYNKTYLVKIDLI